MAEFDKEIAEALVNMAEAAEEKIEKETVEAYNNIESGVVGTYKKIEDGVVGTYKKIEDGFVGAYHKVEDFFVEKLFVRDGETVEDAKKRMIKKEDEEK